MTCPRGGVVLAPPLLLLGLDRGRGRGVAVAQPLPAVVVLAGVQLRRPPSLDDRQAPGQRGDKRVAPGARPPLQEAQQRKRRHAPPPGCKVRPWSGPSRLPALEPEGPGGGPMLQGRNGMS